MRQIHDIDVVLLLAISIAAKRHAAELSEVLAAIEFLQAAPADETKLPAAFLRLSTAGLIGAIADGDMPASLRYAPTAVAQEILASQTRKADTAMRIFAIKERLADYRPGDDEPAIEVTAGQLQAALAGLRAGGKDSGRSLLMPKPKPPEARTRGPGFRLRKPMPAKRRESREPRKR